MLFRIEFPIFKRTINVVTNSKYVLDFLCDELKESSVIEDVQLQSTDNGYIEKDTVKTSQGVAIAPGQSISGLINISGVVIPFLQIMSFDNMQPIRVFLNSVVAEVLKDNYIPLHVSVVESNGYAYAFSGEKNAGKSTLSIGHVLWNNCKLISDDITFFGLNDDGVVICDGIFRGAHIFESEKYMYMNKVFLGGRHKEEYIKKRILFKKGYFTLSPTILDSIIFPNRLNSQNESGVNNMELCEALEAVRGSVIRFDIDYLNMESIIDRICKQAKILKIKRLVSPLDSIEQSFTLLNI